EPFGVDEAVAWRKAGVRALAEARSWRIAGVGADDVSGWLDAGIGFAEASAWHEFGYELDEARRLKADGKTPSESFRNRVQRMSGRSAGGRVRSRQGWSSYASSSSARGMGSQPAQRFIDPAQRFIEKLRGTRGGRQLIHSYHSYIAHQWLDDEAI